MTASALSDDPFSPQTCTALNALRMAITALVQTPLARERLFERLNTVASAARADISNAAITAATTSPA